MKLLRAREADSDRLKDFFQKMTLPGAIDFSIRRQGSFFDQYRLLSKDFETLMMVDDEGAIAGLASLLFREGSVLGEKQTWGYATDLRIAPTRRAIVQWAQLFLPELEQACQERNCRYVFSAVGMQDNQAYNALIRPTSHARRRLPRYQLANRFRTIALHGRVPFAQKPLLSIKLKGAEKNDLEALCAYLAESDKSRPLSTPRTPESLIDELARYPGMLLSDLRIAYDSKGKIRGCAALWNGRNTQSLVPVAYHGFAKTLHQTLRLAGTARLVRPTPRPGEPMPMQWLTHVACDTAEIFHRLADEAYSRLKPREILGYIHFRGNWRTLPPVSFVATSLPFGLYLILPPNAEAPPWPVPSARSLPPEFEGVWL